VAERELEFLILGVADWVYIYELAAIIRRWWTLRIPNAHFCSRRSCSSTFSSIPFGSPETYIVKVEIYDAKWSLLENALLHASEVMRGRLGNSTSRSPALAIRLPAFGYHMTSTVYITKLNIKHRFLLRHVTSSFQAQVGLRTQARTEQSTHSISTKWYESYNFMPSTISIDHLTDVYLHPCIPG
jgi:hypothetical protein